MALLGPSGCKCHPCCGSSPDLTPGLRQHRVPHGGRCHVFRNVGFAAHVPCHDGIDSVAPSQCRIGPEMSGQTIRDQAERSGLNAGFGSVLI